jgi:hypothetical protein
MDIDTTINGECVLTAPYATVVCALWIHLSNRDSTSRGAPQVIKIYKYSRVTHNKLTTQTITEVRA